MNISITNQKMTMSSREGANLYLGTFNVLTPKIKELDFTQIVEKPAAQGRRLEGKNLIKLGQVVKDYHTSNTRLACGVTL